MDITKFESFEKYFKEILKQIKIIEKDASNVAKPIKESSSENKTEKTTDEKPKIINWTKSEVQNWLKEKNVHNSIVNSLQDSDGEILYQSYKMYLKTPQLFYDILMKESNSQLRLIDLLKFTSQLEKLFTD